MCHVNLPPGESDRKFLPDRSGAAILVVNWLFQLYDPSTGSAGLWQDNVQRAKPCLAEVPGPAEGKACLYIAKCVPSSLVVHLTVCE